MEWIGLLGTSTGFRRGQARVEGLVGPGDDADNITVSSASKKAIDRRMDGCDNVLGMVINHGIAHSKGIRTRDPRHAGKANAP